MRNKPTAIEVIARVIGFIPVTIMLFIASMVLFFKSLFNFVVYGGEFIAYNKNTRKTIVDILNKIEEKDDTTRVRKNTKREG